MNLDFLIRAIVLLEENTSDKEGSPSAPQPSEEDKIKLKGIRASAFSNLLGNTLRLHSKHIDPGSENFELAGGIKGKHDSGVGLEDPGGVLHPSKFMIEPIGTNTATGEDVLGHPKALISSEVARRFTTHLNIIRDRKINQVSTTSDEKIGISTSPLALRLGSHIANSLLYDKSDGKTLRQHKEELPETPEGANTYFQHVSKVLEKSRDVYDKLPNELDGGSVVVRRRQPDTGGRRIRTVVRPEQTGYDDLNAVKASSKKETASTSKDTPLTVSAVKTKESDEKQAQSATKASNLPSMENVDILTNKVDIGKLGSALTKQEQGVHPITQYSRGLKNLHKFYTTNLGSLSDEDLESSREHIKTGFASAAKHSKKPEHAEVLHQTLSKFGGVFGLGTGSSPEEKSKSISSGTLFDVEPEKQTALKKDLKGASSVVNAQAERLKAHPVTATMDHLIKGAVALSQSGYLPKSHNKFTKTR